MGRAHTIVVLGNGMRSTLVKGKGVPGERVRVIPIWGRPELNPEPHPPRVREELGVGSEGLLLLYAGNMGIMHPIDSIVDAAAMLRELPARFVFLGDGAKREALESRVERESLDRVTFLPFQPEDRFIELLNAADACFVALEPGMERFSVPSRAFTFLSASRPLITLMAPDADIARLVTEQGCGWNVTTAEDLADLIRRLTHDRTELASRGHKGRLVYEQRFQREHVIDRYAELLRG